MPNSDDASSRSEPAAQTKVQFGAEGIELTLDLGESDASTGEPELDSTALDVNLGIIELTEGVEGKQHTSSLVDIQLVEMNTSPERLSTIEGVDNLIPSHKFVDSAGTESTHVDSASAKSEHVDSAGAKSEHVDSADVKSTKLGGKSPGEGLARRANSAHLRKIGGAANDHAFQQILSSKKPGKHKPKYVKNFTPQDMNRKLVLTDTKPGNQSGKTTAKAAAAENSKSDDEAQSQSKQAKPSSMVVIAPDFKEISEREQREAADKAAVLKAKAAARAEEIARAEEAARAEKDERAAEAAKAEALARAEETARGEETARAVKAARDAEAARAEAFVSAEKVAPAEEIAQAEETTLADETARVEEALRIEKAAAARAEQDARAEEAAIESELNGLSLSSTIDPDLRDAFANPDLTLDDNELDASFADQSVASETASIASLLKSEDTGIQEEIASPQHSPSDTDANANANSNAITDTDTRTDYNLTGNHVDEHAGNELMVRAESGELVTMAELYHSLDVNLDDTFSTVVGAMPNTEYSKPQSKFLRLWTAVKKMSRNLIEAPMGWLKKRRR